MHENSKFVISESFKLACGQSGKMREVMYSWVLRSLTPDQSKPN
jgi:hypothetical protein